MYLSHFSKNRDAVWFYQVSYKSKRFNNPTILQTFVQFFKVQRNRLQRQNCIKHIKTLVSSGKTHAKTIVLAQTFDKGCVRRQ